MLDLKKKKNLNKLFAKNEKHCAKRNGQLEHFRDKSWNSQRMFQGMVMISKLKKWLLDQTGAAGRHGPQSVKIPNFDALKGFATFWEFSFYRQKRSLIMNIMVFLLKKFIFILNFSFLMSSNLGLFPQTWGLRTEYN